MTNQDSQLEEDIRVLRNLQRRMIDDYGWYIEGYIYPGYNHIEFRTHMLGTTFNHPNLQFTLPFNYADVVHLIDDIMDYIRDGVVFLKDSVVAEITDLHGRGPVLLLPVVKDANPENALIRVVLSDENDLFPDDPHCNEEYLHQYDLDLFKNTKPTGAIQ